MKINNQEIDIASYIKETLNNETAFYNEENQKIIVLNSTATTIWNIIEKSYAEQVDICTDDIVDRIKQAYDVNETENYVLVNDVEEAIQLLYDSALLKKI